MNCVLVIWILCSAMKPTSNIQSCWSLADRGHPITMVNTSNDVPCTQKPEDLHCDVTGGGSKGTPWLSICWAGKPFRDGVDGGLVPLRRWH